MTSPYAQAILGGQPPEAIIEYLNTVPDEELGQLDRTGAALHFLAVQIPNDTAALRLLHYLCQERDICDPTLIDRNGQTAVFFAARDGNVECVKYLVQRGCDPSLTDSAMQTALFYAGREGRIDVVKVMVEDMHVDINASDRIGQTALFYAAREGKDEMVKYMLSIGADASIRDVQKKMAHAYAMKGGHAELAALLKSASQLLIEKDSSRGRKRTQTAAATEVRSKYRLQYRVELREGCEVWLYAGLKESSEFEQHFPELAIWSHAAPRDYAPTDAFRMEWCAEGLKVVDTVSNLQSAWFFRKPVDVKAWGCPDYYTIITEPRDFSYIKRKLRNYEYRSIHTFVRDMELIFTNCFKYNPENSEVYRAGEQCQKFCREVFQERDVASWVEKENLLVLYLKEHGLPCNIGPEAEPDAAPWEPPPAAVPSTAMESAEPAVADTTMTPKCEDSEGPEPPTS